MLNLKVWLVALPLLSGVFIPTELGQSVPRPADYFCFERKTNGDLVNLTPLCAKVRQQAATAAASNNTQTPGKNPNTAQPDSSEASANRVRIEGSARRRKIEFSDYSYDGRMLVGTVRNRTGKPISDVSIVYQVEVREGEGRWRTVDNGSIRANNRQVEKGGKTNFSTASARSGDRITITDIEFD